MSVTFLHAGIASGTAAVLTIGGAGGGSDGDGGGSYSTAFTNSSLSSGVLTVTHNLEYEYVVVSVYDNTDKQIIPSEVTTVNANSLQVDLSGFVPITGTWHVTIAK